MKKSVTTYLLSLVLLSFIILTGQVETNLASATNNKRYRSAVKQARTSVEALAATTGIPGLEVAVAINGEMIWSEGVGFADLEQKVPVTTATRFRLGSVSKVLTIAAVARLYEQGRLDIDAPIQKYVPTFPQKEYPITTRQLAGHLAGIRHYKDADRALDFKHFESVLESLSVFQDDPLLHQPGTKYLYSSFGYNLLSAVVEGASGKDFLTYMKTEIFQPLRMSNTTFDQRQALISDRTSFYERAKEAQIMNAPYVDPSYKWASGGLLSTAEDLVHFGSAHLQSSFLKPDTLNLLFTSQKTTDGKETGVGLGWRIGKDWRGRRVLHHAGSITGGRAVLILYPESGLVIALLSNLSNEPAGVELTGQLIAESFLRVIKPADIPNPDKLSSTYRLTGNYRDKSFTADLEIVKSDGLYSGWLTGLTPLDEMSRANGLSAPSRLRIPNVFFENNAPVLVLATPFGLVNMPLTIEGEYVSGKLVMGPLTVNVNGSKVAK